MIPFDPTVWNVAVVLFAFIAGGTVKGVLGIVPRGWGGRCP